MLAISGFFMWVCFWIPVGDRLEAPYIVPYWFTFIVLQAFLESSYRNVRNLICALI